MRRSRLLVARGATSTSCPSTLVPRGTRASSAGLDDEQHSPDWGSARARSSREAQTSLPSSTSRREDRLQRSKRSRDSGSRHVGCGSACVLGYVRSVEESSSIFRRVTRHVLSEDRNSREDRLTEVTAAVLERVPGLARHLALQWLHPSRALAAGLHVTSPIGVREQVLGVVAWVGWSLPRTSNRCGRVIWRVRAGGRSVPVWTITSTGEGSSAFSPRPVRVRLPRSTPLAARHPCSARGGGTAPGRPTRCRGRRATSSARPPAGRGRRRS